MKASPYGLITPAKDEQDHLPQLAQCVISQSHLPEVWVIVDDGSTDGTPQIIEQLADKHTWIHAVRSEQGKERTFGSHFAEVVRMGLDRSVELAGHVQYLIKVDADVRFHDDTFRLLVDTMNSDARLAVASPRLMTLRQDIDVAGLKRPEAILSNKKLVISTDRKRVNEPTDGIRVYRRRYLDEIGGFPITDASDDIVLGKAVIRGYDVGFVDGVWGYLVRETGTTLKSAYARGKVKGYRLYISHYHPLLAAAAFVWDAFSRPGPWPAGVLVGYFESLIKRKKRIDDPDIIRYYGRERFRKVLAFVKGRFAR